jgi:CBS domain containing-hemolysin-like protein
MIGLRLLAVLVLVAINGFFAAAEYALIAVRVSRVRQLIEEGDARARVVNNSSLNSIAWFPAYK